ncbi:MAG: 23S rRNA (adenine(2503)-C(2))-methyltransferase RlmN [Phycisphaerales bacterium]|nr:23S rRNA (adenine(2503)-C(2))-methyltransferase RlmN [Phycisphaerales bacterium]
MKYTTLDIFEQTPETLAAWCEAHGMQRYRAAQILEWVYAKGAADPAEMTNLSVADREILAEEMTFRSAHIVADRQASDGTRKLLVQWRDQGDDSGAVMPVALDAARQTECVMIPTEKRRTACISTQIGCPVGCRFCASGMDGLSGNLTAGRIVEQVHLLSQLTGERISNVVFMGMGEPLANLDAVMHAARIISAPWGLGISGRRITISTVGLPRAIRRLADELDVPATLALSLHAPTDALRREMIPWAKYATIAELLDACRYYFDSTGREITLEYVLLRDENDRPEHARELARIARTLRCNVNLIRYNEVESLPYRRPLSRDVRIFQSVLTNAGVMAHIRASRGRDIAAACGQLRRGSIHDKGV